MKTRILLLSLFIAGVCAAWAQGPNDSGTYYQNADGKKGAALKTALCGVIYAREEGGDLSTAYKALWTHFRTTDAKLVWRQGDAHVHRLVSHVSHR